MPYYHDARRGRIFASFPITEVGNGSVVPPVGFDNRPLSLTGPGLTPNNDPNLGGNWSDDAYRPSNQSSTINQRFNKLWNDWDALGLQNLPRERYCKRFVDLRVMPNFDGAPGPLHPKQGFPRARIVPGSEIVRGPDQTPGPNYGQPVRYTRTTQRPVGPNQYYINYVHQREPNWSLYGLPVPADVFNPGSYVQDNLISAIFQPQFRAGYLEFNSRYGEPLPDGPGNGGGGNITVFYRFQFTEPNDVFAVDYDTRQLMEIALTIRNFPQTTLPNVQAVTLKGSASVRNFMR
jgi:hypothetical protein